MLPLPEASDRRRASATDTAHDPRPRKTRTITNTVHPDPARSPARSGLGPRPSPTVVFVRVIVRVAVGVVVFVEVVVVRGNSRRVVGARRPWIVVRRRRSWPCSPCVRLYPTVVPDCGADSPALAEARRRTILGDAEFVAAEGLRKSMDRLRDDDLFARLTRYLDFENADKTSNHVERENREFRNRQNSHYRMRSLQSLCALLELLTTRHPKPAQPAKLRRRPPDTVVHEEVRRAA